jgi:hypothetical protein
MRRRLLAAFCLLLLSAGCDGPSWLPEALGGEPRSGRIADGPLAEKLHPRLEPLETLGRNGMRVSIAPSFGLHVFVVDFIPQPLGCYLPGPDLDEERYRREGCGLIAVRYTIIGGAEAPEPRLRRFRFHVPEEEYRALVQDYDRLAARWSGSSGGVLDGTSVGIEQWREGRLRSMESNAPILFEPGNPAARALLDVHRLLLAYGPSGAVPRSSSFTIEPQSEADYPCMGQTFATPDPDGFGAGEDPCARQLARPPRR